MNIQQIQVGDYILNDDLATTIIRGSTGGLFYVDVFGNSNTGNRDVTYIQTWAKSQKVKPGIVEIATELERRLENNKDITLYGYHITAKGFINGKDDYVVIKNPKQDWSMPWHSGNRGGMYSDDLFIWLKTQGLSDHPTVKEVAAKVTAYFEEPRTVNGFKISLCDIKNSVMVTTPRGKVYGIGPRDVSGDVQYKVINHLSDLFRNKGEATIPEVAKAILEYKEPRQWHYVNNSVHESGDWKIYVGSTKYILSNETSGHLSFHTYLQSAKEASN